MKKTVKLLLTLAAMALLGALLALSSFAEIYTGSCGENVTYELDTSTGVLEITGTGEMENYSSSSRAPWDSNRSQIKTAIISKGVTSIGNTAFYYCSNLEYVTIENGVTSIGNDAFYFCSSITNIIIPDGVTSIGNTAFYYCYNLTSVTIPDSVNFIGSFAFNGCKLLTSIAIPSSMTTISSCAFAGSGITNMIIPNSVTSIGEWAFGSSKLTSITIPDSVTSIGDQAFQYTHLTSIVIPASVTSIGYGAFYRCRYLESITIADSVTEIEHSAFEDTAFYKNSSNWENGTVLYIGNHLIKAKENLSGVYYIKDCTLTIATGAFSLCNNITNIIIPNSVTRIGCFAFSSCSSITNITIPNGVTSIDHYAFANCSSLTSVAIKTKNATFRSYVFDDCLNLRTIYLYRNSTADTFFPDTKYTKIYFDEPHDHVSFMGWHTDQVNHWKECICDEVFDFAPHEDINNDYICDFCNLEVDINCDFFEKGDINAKGDNPDVLEKGTQMNVTQLQKGELGNFAISKENGKKPDMVGYDITFEYEGEEVQPNGYVTVKIKVPNNFNGKKCKVYHYAEDGTATDMEAEFIDGYMVFRTNHFSIYLLADMSVSNYGDANGNGEIDIKDLVLLAQYLAGWNVSIDSEISDCNTDGKVNIKDIVLLSQYLAGWEIILG